MDEATLERFAKELAAVVACNESCRGAPKFCSPREIAKAAAAFAQLGRVAIISGFYIPAAKAPETDGPGGAAVLARAFLKEGRSCEIWTDALCLDVMRAGARAAGCPEDIAREAPSSLDGAAPEGIIFIERPGRAADGRYYNFRKQDISRWTAPLDSFAYEAASRGIVTAGIGDGGNEAGMGNFRKGLCALLPDYVSCLSVVRTDFSIAADISNMGAYALALALSLVWGRMRGIERGDETKILEAVVSAGAVDGISGRRETSVDGFKAAVLEKKVSLLNALRRRYAGLGISGS